MFASGALALISIWLASGLQIRSSFEELLPSDVASVRHVKELVQRVGGDGTVLVVVQVLDPADGLEHAKELTRQLAQEYLDFGPSIIRAVEWNVKPTERWFADDWPMFVSLEDLRKALETLRTEMELVLVFELVFQLVGARDY